MLIYKKKGKDLQDFISYQMMIFLKYYLKQNNQPQSNLILKKYFKIFMK